MRALELPSVVAVLQHGSPVQRASFNPKGDLILTSTADGKARLWSVSAGRQERLLAHQERAVTHVMFSPSGEIAVTIDGKAHVWRVVDGVELATLSVENEEIQTPFLALTIASSQRSPRAGRSACGTF